MSEVNNKWPQEGINPDVNKEYISPKIKPEDMAIQKEISRDKLWDLKSEVWVFEHEPDMRMCAYTWLKIKFPWKKIKNIISITSSTWWVLNNYKVAEDKLTFNIADKSWENKDIDKKIVHSDTVQFDWITPNTKETTLTFMVELEDGTEEIIKRKVKLPNKPFTVKESKTRKSWIDNHYNSPAIDNNGIGRIEKSASMNNLKWLKWWEVEYYVFQYFDEDLDTWVNDNSVWINNPSINNKGELIWSYNASWYKGKVIRTHIEILKDWVIKNHDYWVWPI